MAAALLEGYSLDEREKANIVFAKINNLTGARAGSDDPDAVYAAFMENHLPPERLVSSNESELSQLSGSASESFFKSDLF